MVQPTNYTSEVRDISMWKIFQYPAVSAVSILASRNLAHDVLFLSPDGELQLWNGSPKVLSCSVSFPIVARTDKMFLGGNNGARESEGASAVVGKRRREEDVSLLLEERTASQQVEAVASIDDGVLEELDDLFNRDISQLTSLVAQCIGSKDGSLIASTGEADEDDLIYRSPSRSARVTGLRQSVADRFTIEMSNGVHIRAKLDVRIRKGLCIDAMNALAYVLPRQEYTAFYRDYIQLLYADRRKLVSMLSGSRVLHGNQIMLQCPDSEVAAFDLFCALLFSRILDSGARIVNIANRQLEAAGSDNWQWLLLQPEHTVISSDPALPCIERETTATHNDYWIQCVFSTAIALQSIFPAENEFSRHLAGVFLALHYLFQEYTLQSILCSKADFLVRLLSHLAPLVDCAHFARMYAQWTGYENHLIIEGSMLKVLLRRRAYKKC